MRYMIRMKTTAMLKFILPLTFLMASFQFSYSQQGGYATVRVFDCNKGVGMGLGYLQAKIIIVYEDGKSEEIGLQPYSEKTETDNLKKVNEVINELKAKGYFLISQSTTGEQGSLVTDYTFLKQL